MALSLESSSIRDGELIGDAYAFGVLTADGPAPAGGNRSPHLRWSGAPEGTQSYAVLVVDPDVPVDTSDIGVEGRTIAEDRDRRDFAHLLLVDVPASVTELPEGALSDGIVVRGKPTGPASVGGVTGANDYTGFMAGDDSMAGTYGAYDGCFPPPNDLAVHHYHFTVYALDVPTLGLSGDFDLAATRAAMEGHVLESAEIVGLYSLNADVRKGL